MYIYIERERLYNKYNSSITKVKLYVAYIYFEFLFDILYLLIQPMFTCNIFWIKICRIIHNMTYCCVFADKFNHNFYQKN